MAPWYIATEYGTGTFCAKHFSKFYSKAKQMGETMPIFIYFFFLAGSYFDLFQTHFIQSRDTSYVV